VLCSVVFYVFQFGRIIGAPFVRFVGSIVWFIYFLLIIMLMAYQTYMSDVSKRYARQAYDSSSSLNQFFRNVSFPSNKGTREEPFERMVLASFILCWVVGK
jgi:ABC-type spermidine/putrescine transport system permease subunit I